MTWCLEHRSAIVPAGGKRSRTRTLTEFATDGCLLQAMSSGRLLGLAALHLPTGGIAELAFADSGTERALLPTLLDRLERLAVRFAIDTLILVSPRGGIQRFESLGYRESGSGDAHTSTLRRSLARRQTGYGRRIRSIGEALGIPSDYARAHRLPLQTEATRLESIGDDAFGREQRLAPRAAQAWRRLVAGAAADRIEIQAVSAYRSVDYQRALLERKLERGQTMAEILEVSAAPGYSEHHTGTAIDVSTPGARPLETSFEDTAAFRWLSANAARFGFHLSFPRDNRHGLSYEPWHWRHRGGQAGLSEARRTTR